MELCHLDFGDSGGSFPHQEVCLLIPVLERTPSLTLFWHLLRLQA